MSMLTPPGMGGKYRITGDKYPRMRRGRSRSRIVLAVVASVAAIGLIGWGSFQLVDVFTGGGRTRTAASGAAGCPKHPSASPSPAKAAAKLPDPAKIKVNVLNATTRGGLAKDTADELKKRGFAIGDVGNATETYDKKVTGVGILLGAKSASDAALPVLGTQLAGAELKSDTRAKPTEVDLIIGKQFKGLSKKADADKALAALTHPAPSASPSCAP
ncbi:MULTISPECIES: LytR C-terminal domain-containing protein [unclassified Streptomyces]|uniref:LytR C-terminal domain-containing protein n=1 Tax=unclassified Streptomyces TaxID=2593676 RepID=UPI000DC422CB|nr:MULTISPECIES: LytR C-terminal domain-containing protein [unclassified Streptomyces]RAJ73777.1 LytR cell envelope-related transcriptional attenuator [Streptomyces sp. PsTaAH-137]